MRVVGRSEGFGRGGRCEGLRADLGRRLEVEGRGGAGGLMLVQSGRARRALRAALVEEAARGGGYSASVRKE
jgi:hypothetical protein